MTRKERLLLHAKMVIDNLPTTDAEIEAIIDTAIRKVTIDLPVITKTIILDSPKKIIDFSEINDYKLTKKNNDNSEFIIFEKEPIRVLAITDNKMHSVMHDLKKIGQLKYLNEKLHCVLIVLLQYNIEFEHIDILSDANFDLIFNAIIYKIRSLIHDFTNSEPHSELGTIYKKQYKSEIYKISDEFLYIDDLNLKTRIGQYE